MFVVGQFRFSSSLLRSWGTLQDLDLALLCSCTLHHWLSLCVQMPGECLTGLTLCLGRSSLHWGIRATERALSSPCMLSGEWLTAGITLTGIFFGLSFCQIGNASGRSQTSFYVGCVRVSAFWEKEMQCWANYNNALQMVADFFFFSESVT